MDVMDYTPTRDQYAYTFGGVAPALQIRPGSVLRLWSDDAFGGALSSVDDLSSAKVDLRFFNPQTGPFYVEGAEPGEPSYSTSSRWNQRGTGVPRPRSPSSAG